MDNEQELRCKCCGMPICSTSEGQFGERGESGFDVFFLHDYPDDYPYWEHKCKEDLNEFDMWFPSNVSTSKAYQIHHDNYKNGRM